MADRVRSMPPGTPHLMLIGELDGEPVADAFYIGKGAAQNGYALSGVYVLPHARGRGVGGAISDLLVEARRAHGLPGTADSVHALDEDSMAAAAGWATGAGAPPRVGAGPRHPGRRGGGGLA